MSLRGIPQKGLKIGERTSTIPGTESSRSLRVASKINQFVSTKSLGSLSPFSAILATAATIWKPGLVVLDSMKASVLPSQGFFSRT